MRNELTLGVIGGLGPIATAHFMELVTVMTDAKTDQEHLEMIVFSAPSIPDRTAHILDDTKPSPLPRMVAIGRKLSDMGAARIAIPCITAHYFIEPLEAGIPVPLVNGVRETAAHLKAHGVKTAGIMATDGTIRAGIFRRELEKQGIEAVTPSARGQKYVMSLIYDNVKAGVQPDMAKFRAVGQELFDAGAEAIILGCTELSMIKRDFAIGPGYIDAMEVLAQSSVLACGKPLKNEYRDLITR